MIYRYLKIIITFSILGVLISCSAKSNADDSDMNKSDSSNQDSTKQDSSRNANSKELKANSDLIPVETAAIGSGSISNFLLLSSNLETEVQADVFPRAQGIVQSINKEEGDFVKKGDVLLTLEAREYQIAAGKAKVEFDRQKSLFDRQEVMFKEHLLSQEEFDQVKYTMEAAKYTYEDAKLRLEYMSIESPITGQIGERTAKIGARVQPSDKLFSVVNNSEMIAVLYIPEKNINELKPNQTAIVTSENLGKNKFNARIKRISPVVDPASGTFKVTVSVSNNKQQELKPGMFVNVHLIIDTHENAILVPKTAVVYENEFMNVFVVKDSIAHKIRLKAGFEDSEKIESLSDLADGDKVIVVGQAGMKDKTKVRVVHEREINFLAAKEKH